MRKATIRDIAKATLIAQRVRTTKDKAKEARKLVDRLITLGKKDTLAAKRKAFSILCDHKLVSNLFSKIAVRFKNRAGGYTRIIPLHTRRGDNASLAYLELTEKLIDEKSLKKVSSGKSKVSSLAKKKEPAKAQGKSDAVESEQEKEEHAQKPEQSQKSSVDTKEDKGKSPKERAGGGIKKLFKKKPPSQQA